MNWQLFLLISMVADTAGRLIQRTFLKDEKSDPIAYAALFQIFCGIIIGVIALIVGIQIPDIRAIWWNLIITAVIYGLATICIYKSLKTVEASVFTILFASRAVWTVLGGVVLLHESFFPIQILGAALILGSVVLISWTKMSLKMQAGEYYALAAAGLFAIGTINDAYVLQNADPATYLIYGFIAPGILIWLLYWKKSKIILQTMTSRASLNVWLISVVYAASALGFFWAYKVGNNIAQIASVYQISSILTVILAIVLLKERGQLLRKIIAAVIGLVGVYLVS